MSVLTTQGYGKGSISRNVPNLGDDNIPLLSSFYFRFEKRGSSEAVDNHINQIMVLPGGVSTDLSPNADLVPNTQIAEKIDLMMADRNPNDSASDRYYYRVSHSTLPRTLISNAQRFQFRDAGCTGRCRQVLPPSPISGRSLFVLCGFQLFFTGGRDHHIDRISVMENNGDLVIDFRDKSASLTDVYGYLVDYAWIPFGHNVDIGEETGSARGGARIPLNGQKLIRGFSFDFATSDHHLREIGVASVNDNLEVFYSDWNGDDSFRWNVRWATISEPVIGQ